MDLKLSRLKSILGGEKVLRHPLRNEMDFINLINRGVSKSALMNLIEHLGFTTQQIAKILPITERTIRRYRPDQLFMPNVSEQIIQIAKVTAKGSEVFDSKKEFRLWLTFPNKSLGNKTPLSLMSTQPGAELVINIIKQGVYS